MRIRAALMRGGASRGLLIHQRDLPSDRQSWSQLFASAMGSPDPGGRQVDGVGGGTPTTSKVAVVGTSTHPDADVDYDYYQVGVRNGDIYRTATCGNLTSAAARFALEEDISFRASDPIVLHDTITDRLVSVVLGGDPTTSDEPIKASVSFLRPAGRITGKLLPTSNATDTVGTMMGEAIVTLVDFVNPTAVVDATSIGVGEPMAREALEGDRQLMEALDQVRRWAAVILGLADSESAAPEQAPYLPFVGLAFPTRVQDGGDVELPVRLLSGQTAHHAVPLGAALATASTVAIEGSPFICGGSRVVLSHPSGLLPIRIHKSQHGEIESIAVDLTTRRIMDGTIVIP